MSGNDAYQRYSGYEKLSLDKTDVLSARPDMEELPVREETCFYCRFWHPTPTPDGLIPEGQCRRRQPPWHNALALDWCGEFALAEESSVKIRMSKTS